jgi:hypothetical protein
MQVQVNSNPVIANGLVKDTLQQGETRQHVMLVLLKISCCDIINIRLYLSFFLTIKAAHPSRI